jgi:hypothetical protein
MLTQEILLKDSIKLEYPELMTSNGKSNLRVNSILVKMTTFSRLLMLSSLMVMNILVMEVDLSLLH